MRVSPANIREGLLNPSYSIPKTKPAIVTTHGIATKAIRVFHTDGESAADAYLRNTFGQGKWRTGAMGTKAKNTVNAFATYKDMAGGDERPVVLGDSRASILIGTNDVAAACNVVLMGDPGMSGRVCLWGVLKREFSVSELELMSCPVVLALDEEFGADRVVDLEIWTLRSGDAARISAHNARSRQSELVELVDRLTL